MDASNNWSAGPINTNLRTLGAYVSQAGALPGNFLTGDVDEFCVFGRALTDGEIRRLAGAGGP